MYESITHTHYDTYRSAGTCEAPELKIVPQTLIPVYLFQGGKNLTSQTLILANKAAGVRTNGAPPSSVDISIITPNDDVPCEQSCACLLCMSKLLALPFILI